jgi:hypothetical protein
MSPCITSATNAPTAPKGAVIERKFMNDLYLIIFLALCLDGIAVFIAASRKLSRSQIYNTVGFSLVASPVIGLLYAILARHGEGDPIPNTPKNDGFHPSDDAFL